MPAVRPSLAIALMAIVTAACGAHGAAPPASGSWLGPVRALRSPAGASSGQPRLRASTGATLLSWVERRETTATLKFATYDNARWSTPRVVAAGDDWFVNWADVPSVVRLDDGTLAAHWLQKSGADKYAYDVRLSHSRDDGRTWAPSFTPHHDGTKTEHGFAALFEMAGQGLGLVWLDGRQMQGVAGHEGSHGSPTGAMTLRFGGYDREWRQVADTAVDLRVCDCCPTAAAITSDGPIVAFRDRAADEVRDIHVSRLEDGRWTRPVAVHDDGWRIAACPVNGPMLSARGRRVALAWFTAAGGTGHAYLAFSDDAGRTFGRPVRVDDRASLGRVDVELLADGAAVVTWIELDDPGAAFMVRRVAAGGERSDAVRVATLAGSRTSGYPRVALHGRELIFAWTETGSGDNAVRTSVAALMP